MDSGAVVSPPQVGGPFRLLPFQGLRLAPNRIGDQISARAFARPYRGVAARLIAWERTGQLAHDATAALYLHEYTAAGVTVRGLVGALDISHTATRIEDVVVLPHEGIHPAQAAELADRMAEMEMNPAPILLVHRGSDDVRRILREVRDGEPNHQFTDRSGHYHRVWAIHGPARLEALTDGLAGARTLVADGHHRFAAYLRLRETLPGPATDAGLAMLVDQGDTPLYLGAIHRVLVGATLADIATAPQVASFTRTGPEEAVASLGADTLVATDGHDWGILRLQVGPERLAVQALHNDLLPVLAHPASDIEYAHSVDDALLGVVDRPAVAILMPAPEFGDVLRIAATGQLLPEKATSFQPKPSVGVLIRSLRDG
ncbi:DUF1015 family protein [Nocardioides sp. CN2-186]|uniref:DUF1015 family protein n=1 Tax=Nocardioides tweenelious TaxID=3156607 RepID=UPI0032B589DC